MKVVFLLTFLHLQKLIMHISIASFILNTLAWIRFPVLQTNPIIFRNLNWVVNFWNLDAKLKRKMVSKYLVLRLIKTFLLGCSLYFYCYFRKQWIQRTSWQMPSIISTHNINNTLNIVQVMISINWFIPLLSYPWGNLWNNYKLEHSISRLWSSFIAI